MQIVLNGLILLQRVMCQHFEYAIFRERWRQRHVLLTDGKKTDFQLVGWVIGQRSKNAYRKLPASSPTFLLVTYPLIFSSIHLASFLNVTQDSILCVLPPANVFGLQPKRSGSSFRPVLSCSVQHKYSSD